MARQLQRAICCPCGRDRILALGLCSTCYTLRRQDEAYFGGHREEVLERDGYRCCVPGCTTVKRGKRSVAVHHRRPGNNDPKGMATLCLACHAKVTRTRLLRRSWPPHLILLWREQHPYAQEQTALDFAIKPTPLRHIPMFEELSSEPDSSKATATTLAKWKGREGKTSGVPPLMVQWKPPKNVGPEKANPFHDVSRSEPCFAC